MPANFIPEAVAPIIRFMYTGRYLVPAGTTASAWYYRKFNLRIFSYCTRSPGTILVEQEKIILCSVFSKKNPSLKGTVTQY